MNKQEQKEFKQLEKENNNIRAEFESYFLKYRFTEKDRDNFLIQIELLINNEVEQENYCNQ